MHYAMLLVHRLLRRRLDVLPVSVLLLLVPQLLEVCENGARQGMSGRDLTHDNEPIPPDGPRWDLQT
eukprot:7905426-Karenia_brevis.AAC.1